MIRFHAFGVGFSLPLPALLVPLLANRLGLGGAIPYLIVALGIHELAHVLAAKIMQVSITEIRLLPFGGSARMENPYGLTAGQLIVTAIAGPSANLLLALLMAALAQWQLIRPEVAAAHVQPNLVLMLFNLFPALPLDGGRILFALLQRPLGEDRALLAGRIGGRILAVLLICTAVTSGLHTGKWNLSFLLAAVFILSSEGDESSALSRARVQRLENALQKPTNPQPARIYHVDEHLPLHRAMKLMRPKENTWFVLTRSGIPSGLIDGCSLLSALVSGSSPDTPLHDLDGFTMQRNSSAT